MKIFDAHCHIYPAMIAQKAAAATAKFYEGLGITLDGTVKTLFEHSGEITMHLVQSVATTQAQVHSVNNFIAREVALYPHRLYGFGTLHPDSTREDIRQLRSLGLHGVKLHPDIQAFQLDDPRNHPMYALCEQEGLPLLLHTGDSRYDNSNPNRLLPVLKAYPGLTVIGAHLGGYSVWEEAVEQLAGIPNLYVDCSSCFWKLSKADARRFIRAYGTDQVLFGSDYPMWNVQNELAFFLDLDLTDDELRGILSVNAERVFLGQ